MNSAAFRSAEIPATNAFVTARGLAADPENRVSYAYVTNRYVNGSTGAATASSRLCTRHWGRRAWERAEPACPGPGRTQGASTLSRTTATIAGLSGV